MIVIESGLNLKGVPSFDVLRQVVDTSTEATVIIRRIIDIADAHMMVADARLWLRVTGGPTAAACRHHPLSPGTIGDPRR